ncbi:DNA double-strand break repair nuclease NurA [Candidatus Micrarchaeota archaeon]|nr:DNA double-strand break repair nuclease NurA [Candidatus Micrarchaeota archaeon]
MRERIAELAREIREGYEGLRKKARIARETDPSLVIGVGRSPISLSVCAVDGGLLAGRMHGADIVVARAVAAHFVYECSKIKSNAYLPSKSPKPALDIRNSLEEHEALVFRSLIRLRHELACAIEALDKFRPRLLLMDGSLLPLPGDRPPEGSGLRPLYDEVLSLYGKLYSGCGDRGCMLCGVVKDSRSRKLAKELGASCSDTLLCGYLLEEGERTREMGYFEGKAPNAEVGALGGRIRVFYLKPSKNDLPLRIELLDSGVDEAASAICSLSAISDNFAYPAILIEADMCAALDSAELESIEASLSAQSGLRPLRRNSRPFR